MKKVLLFTYSVFTYLIFFTTFLYAICFVGNIFVAKSLDSEPLMPVVPALLINGGLFLLFAVQYNFLQSASWKRWMAKYIPETIERSTMVMLACANLIILMWQWQPIGGLIWEIDNHTAKTVFLIINLVGWSAMFFSTFLINHFDFVGLRQTWMHVLNKPYQNLPFRDPLFYRLVRHPMQLGLVIMLWSASTMTVVHLFFTLLTTAYVITSIQMEERQLLFESGHRNTNHNSITMFSIDRKKKEKKEAYKKA
jgi:protein-S-isoprenylcysteine O-methyltransferase Ste14